VPAANIVSPCQTSFGRPSGTLDPFPLNAENVIKVIKKEDDQTYIKASTKEK